MSGLEIAGVVLGVIPLFISALEHYEEGLRPLSALRWKTYRRELSKYRTKLSVEYGLYTNALEELLVDVVSEADLANMMAQGYGPAWKQPALNNRLRTRLGRVYETYLLVMNQMRDVMARIASLLNLQNQGTVTADQLEALLLAHPTKHASSQNAPKFTAYEFRKRLKFGFKSGQIQPLLDELGRYNAALYQFTESSRRLELLRPAAPKDTFATPIHNVRDCAERLYRCLGGAWACTRHTDHVLHLQLDSRISKPQTPAKDSDDNVLFTMAFSHILCPDQWQPLEIHVFSDQAPVKLSGKVNFASTPTQPSIDLSTLPAVDCLCSAVSTSGAHSSLGFCLDHKQKLLANYPLSQQTTNTSSTPSRYTKSLEDVLSKSPATARSKPFSSKQAYYLGLTVASSFLQLRATPWLCGSWRAADVLFVNEPATNLIDFDKPHIRQNYPTAQQLPLSGQATVGADNVDDNCSFLNLGIMLLEIFFREPIDARRWQSDSSPNQSFSDLQTAKRWIQQDKEEMPTGFYKAVAFCIGCFASLNVDLRDKNFRQTVVDQVIVPLKDELKMWNA